MQTLINQIEEIVAVIENFAMCRDLDPKILEILLEEFNDDPTLTSKLVFCFYEHKAFNFVLKELYPSLKDLKHRQIAHQFDRQLNLKSISLQHKITFYVQFIWSKLSFS